MLHFSTALLFHARCSVFKTAFRKFLEQKNGKIVAILALDVTRWGRFEKPREGIYWEMHFERMGVEVLYVNEEFRNDDSTVDTIVRTLKHSSAGDFSKELSVKVLQGSKTVASKGFSVGGTPPFGYDRMLVDSSGNPIRVLKPGERKYEKTQRIVFTPADGEKVALVRRIFDMYSDKDMGIRRIMDILNSEMIPSPKGNKWTVGTISTMLQNPAYIGQLVYNRNANKRRKRKPGEIRKSRKHPDEWVIVENAHEALVSKECFDKVQAKFKSHKGQPNWDNSPYILRDVMVCAKCGQGFSGYSKHNGSGRQYQYYTDGGYERYGSSFCKRTMVNKRTIEGLILEKLFGQLTEKDVVERIRDKLQEAMGDYGEKATEDIKLIDKEIGRIDSELHKLIDFIKTGESQSCRIEITRLEARKQVLESRKAVLTQGSSLPENCEAEIDEIKSDLKNLKSILFNGDLVQTRKFIGKVIPRIEVDPDKRVARIFMLNLTDKDRGMALK